MGKIFIISNFHYLETDYFRPVHLNVFFISHLVAMLTQLTAGSPLIQGWFSLDLGVLGKIRWVVLYLPIFKEFYKIGRNSGLLPLVPDPFETS